MRQKLSSRPSPKFAVIPELDAELRRRLDLFQPAVHATLAPLMTRSRELADLSESFPAMLFALGTGYGDDTARSAALAAVMAGQSLKEAARQLGLPLWLRKVPGAAFTAPLLPPPADPGLVERLVSLIPAQPAAASAWLERVLIAHQLGETALTLWVAQQYRTAKPAPQGATFLGTLAWAWHASRPRGNAASAFVTTPWKPNLGAARASKEAALWRERIALEVCLGTGLTDTWLADGEAAGLSFVALRTASDFIAEARHMDNCLDRYAGKLEGRAVRVFSIRRAGRSIANIEICAHEREPGHPVISQLRGPHNRRAALEVWRAAYQWLGGQPLRLADRRIAIRVGPAVRKRRQDEIWRAFLDRLPERARTAFESSVLSRRKARTASSSSSVPPAEERPKTRG